MTPCNPNNIWQIGSPQKQILSTAYSPSNVIITDTINPYPINDTSSFIISKTASGGVLGPGWVGTEFFISGQYYVNSDTLNDFGMIEFSPDNGDTWIDLLTYDPYDEYITWYDGNGGNTRPTLSGNSGGWKFFLADLYPLGWMFDINFEDTMLYRFSFISDSIDNGMDGLMFDNLDVHDFFSSISEIDSHSLFVAGPNPVRDILNIKFNSPEFVIGRFNELYITNQLGQVLLTKRLDNFNVLSDNIELDLSNLSPGIYLLQIGNENWIDSKKIIVE